MDIQKLRDIKQKLKEIQGNTLDDVITKMCECYDTGNADIQMVIGAAFDTEKVTHSYAVTYLVQTLKPNRAQEESEETNLEDSDIESVKALLSIDIKEFEKWFFYIERKWNSDIIYHTYHGTKGLEFDNVLIMLEDGFGTSADDRIFIKKFLEDFDSLNEKMPIGNYEKARNLLYVAVTRAVKNLKVVYVGESERVRETLEAVFGIEKGV